MKKIGIFGAMDLEVETLINTMKEVKEHKCAGTSFYQGKLANKEVVVACCGVGKVNAASCTQALISIFDIDGIINTGIAGGMRPDVKVCDIVVSNEVTHHDVRREQMIHCYPNVEVFKADPHLIQVAKEVLQSNDHLHGNHHIGKIVSGECFVNDKELKESIIENHKPHCVEMEGSAIGHVAYLNNIPFVVIRSISDNADNEADMTYKEFESIAARQSSNLVMEMLKHL